MQGCTRFAARVARVVLALLAAAFVAGCEGTRRPANGGGLYHVGLIWLQEPGNAEHRRKIVAAAQAFAREIPEVRALAVGQPPPSASPYVDDSFDVCVVMQFADREEMER